MPKKPPRNAFYYYMLDFQNEQKKKGIHFTNLAEVASAAGEPWKSVPPSVRSEYEARAKAAKNKGNVLETKFTSQGVPLSVIEQQQKELKEAEETERQDVMALVRSNVYSSKNILKRDIYLMDVNYYCKTGSQYLIGECTLLRFNLEQGIVDTYHELINPGTIPVGYASDVKLGCQDYGLDMPDSSAKRTDYMQILANIIDYLKQQDRKTNTLPPIFTLPDKVEPVYDFIQQLCNRAAEDDSIFRVYKLDFLFYTLINNIKIKETDGFPKESLAFILLNKDNFKYTPKIACPHHEPGVEEEAVDKSVECTTSRTKRWAFTVLDSCCPLVGIPMEPGKHLPFDFDTEGIHTYKEQKKVRTAPSVAFPGNSGANSSYSASVLSDSFNDSSTTTRTEVNKPKRTHTPLRMPKNYSKEFNAAPELDNINFPALNLGRGRGRKNN